MKKLIIYFLFLPLSYGKTHLSSSQKIILKEKINKDWTLSENQWESLTNGDVVADAEASTSHHLQKMSYKVAGIHSRVCRVALRKISQYESYSSFMSFVKKSHYDENKKMIELLLDHSLMPYSMILRFQIPRIQNVGRYPYQFNEGIFVGLAGEIIVEDIQGRCLLMMKGSWQGAPTNISSGILEIFTQTVIQLGLENLIRISRL